MAEPTKVAQQTEELRDQFSEFSQMLQERREEILNRVDVERSHLDEQVMMAPGDAADESVIDTSADYFLRLANNHQRELGEISDALDRMHRGVYGSCENCENAIAMERLRRLPYARFCIDCQSAQERGNRLRVVPPKL
jgi:DnaK suppressor protein